MLRQDMYNMKISNFFFLVEIEWWKNPQHSKFIKKDESIRNETKRLSQNLPEINKYNKEIEN